MFEKTQDSFETLFKYFDKEIDAFFKIFDKKFSKGTKIKIGKGSIVNINGASAKLLNDVTVITENPDTLMCKKS